MNDCGVFTFFWEAGVKTSWLTQDILVGLNFKSAPLSLKSFPGTKTKFCVFIFKEILQASKFMFQS
jgi:hypothetical protein